VTAYGDVLTALADPTRRQVFELLRRGPRPVGALADELPVSRPAVSQHLRVLKDAGLVREERSGTRRLYTPNGEGLAALRDYLDGYWDEALAAFKAAAEQETEGDDDAGDR
jgi:DNA-binding transcriptional ArsR family regulator